MNPTGSEAESRAAAYLEARGLALLERNFRCRFGEIDLIMRDDETIVFVEVRARSRPDFGGAVESVTRSKQRRLLLAARFFLSRLATIPRCRFDVVAFDGAGQIEWIRNAFGE